MLSIEECRRVLGDPDLSDERIAELRDALHAFAVLFVDEYLREARERRLPTPR